MLSFNNDKVSIFWDYAKLSSTQYSPKYWYYISKDNHFIPDRYSYQMNSHRACIDIPRDKFTPNNEYIIIIDLFGLNNSNDRGKGIGTTAMNEFLKIYGKYDIFLNVGILATEDKETIDEDPNTEIYFINKICNFYSKFGFNELESSIIQSLDYKYRVLMMRNKTN